MRLLIAACAIFLAACGSVPAAGCSAALPADRAATPAAGSCLTESVTTDRQLYSVGAAKLDVTVTSRNTSSQACGGSQDVVCGGPALQVVDTNGSVVLAHPRAQQVCPLALILLQPGQSQSLHLVLDLTAQPAGVYGIEAGKQQPTDLGTHYFKIC